MEDNNIDISVDLEADDNIDVNQVFHNEATEIDQEAREKDEGKEMQCNDEQNKNMIVELGKAQKVIVDVEQPKKGTKKMDEKSKECKHIEDAPSYSLGLTQDGLILTGEEQQNTGQNVEAGNIDFDKVPEVPKTLYIQKEVEDINQQTDKGTRERDVDVVESRNTTVDANNEATNEEAENVDVDMNQQMHENEKQENEATSKLNEEGVKNIDDNDDPNYSLGLTQDGLILTKDSQINKDKEGDDEVQKENEIIVGEEDIETDIPLDMEPISQYFCSKVSGMLNKTDSSMDECYAKFRRNMYGGISRKKIMKMKQVDIILFPILEHGHYYLVNFELKIGAITVIDNFHESIALVGLKDSEDYLLKDSTYKIKALFVEYLERHCYPKAYEIKKMQKIKKINIPWATKQNEFECGDFVMRHMEKYMGIKEPFICGLNSNEMKKKRQLNALRKKYAAHILQSSANLLKEKF
ncbi:hypothetical protein L1987_18345 [Smallanthus sonchifolius]|uniref:Uncharacterized protein n=1 Tax=Smallanthus sonchifolius TaxID=185202 RepID=A0ACB9J0J2_9ASTR|nr:hypothetical protein L1987_18345 [Smallanthus sonchifolius]